MRISILAGHLMSRPNTLTQTVMSIEQIACSGAGHTLPVAAQLAVSDHARLPVMMPRQSDGKMRRDGSSAARPQPSHPVAERGGLHGAPELSTVVERRIAAKRRRTLRAIEERRRWRRRSDSSHRLGRQDKAGGPAAGTSFLRLCLHIVFCPARDLMARCARRG